MAEVLLNQKITTRVLLMGSPFYIVILPVLPFCMGYPEEICWTWFDILIYASTTQKVICSFELSLFSCLLTLVYQLIVKSMRAFVYRCLILLWSVKPFYRRMTRRNKLQYLFHIQDWVKVVVFRRSNANPAFGSVLPWSITIFYIGIVIGIAHHPMNSWYSDTSCHHCSFLGSVLLQPECRQVNHDVWTQYS